MAGVPVVIAGLVLAAGASTRMGRQKLLLPVGGRALVRLAVERALAAGLQEVVVVVGGDATAVQEALAGLPVRTVVNPRFAEGLSTSLRAGLAALDPDTEAVVVTLGDQPLVDPEVTRRLVAAYRARGAPVVVARYRDGRGHPVLFAASVFPELQAASGDEGGRAVIARVPERVVEVPVDAPAPADVDTPEDYEALREAVRGQG